MILDAAINIFLFRSRDKRATTTPQINMAKHSLPLLSCVSAASTLVALTAFAQNQTVEQVAQTIDAQHNQNATLMRDEMTVSSKASATGKNVRFENVLRVKQGLPKAKLQEFDSETRREIIPRVCAVQGNEIGFKRGLSYTFSYASTYGERLSEFTVDAKTCGIKQ